MDGLKGKSVVVTGASGYIGSKLVNELLKHSCEVIRVCREPSTSFENSALIEGDIRSKSVWQKIVARADVIYHLAGNTSVYEAAKNPVESLNSGLLPINHLIDVLQGCQSKPRVIFASTATVYGLTPRLPVSEISQPMPITIYDLHKLFVEQQLSLASREGLMESVSLRLSNVYGPSLGISAKDRGVLNKVTLRALNGENLLVYGDGDYLRDYVYIDDVVYAFLLIGSKKEINSGVYNVSSGKSISVEEAFKMVAWRASLSTGKNVNVNYAPWPIGANPIEYRDYVADIRCISSQIGWRPKIDLASGIDCMVEEMIKARKIQRAFQ